MRGGEICDSNAGPWPFHKYRIMQDLGLKTNADFNSTLPLRADWCAVIQTRTSFTLYGYIALSPHLRESRGSASPKSGAGSCRPGHPWESDVAVTLRRRRGRNPIARTSPAINSVTSA